LRLQFDEFLVDEDTRQVLRDGTAIHVSPKAFDLLATLIRERPRALPKTDLHARLWPKTYVSDASLAMLVAELRAALGESARAPRYLRTVHRHGYAFQGEAHELPARRTEAGTASPDLGPAIGYWLVTTSGQIPLQPGDNIIGRDPGSRVWLDSSSVSRRHARIRVECGRAVLEDLDSKNGTRIGDTRVIAATPLTDGDTVKFGSIEVTFRTWAAEATRTEGDA
jgi:DNA-binding winged helix-turn-helix (wHTH) protein